MIDNACGKDYVKGGRFGYCHRSEIKPLISEGPAWRINIEVFLSWGLMHRRPHQKAAAAEGRPDPEEE